MASHAFLIWSISLFLILSAGRYKLHKDSKHHSFFCYIYKLCRSLSLAGSDLLTILAAVYGTIFWANGKCTMAVYHYYVALDSILLACSTIAVAFAASGRPFWKTPAALWRLLSTLVVFVFLGIFLLYQLLKHANANFPELLPPKDRLDSAILLPVSCFLDSDLVDKESPYAPSQRQLNDAQLESIGRPIEIIKLPQNWSFVLLSLSLLSGVFAQMFLSQIKYKIQKLLLGFIILLSLVTDIFCTCHMFMLKDWTSRSGWMEDRGEEGYYAIGQLLPVVSLALVVIAALEKIEFSCWKRSRDKKYKALEGYQMT